MSPTSKSPRGRLLWGLLLGLLILPAAQVSTGAAQSAPAVALSDASVSWASGSHGALTTLLAPGVPGKPGDGDGGGSDGSNPGPEEGDPDDFGCRVQIRLIELEVAQAFFLMWL